MAGERRERGRGAVDSVDGETAASLAFFLLLFFFFFSINDLFAAATIGGDGAASSGIAGVFGSGDLISSSSLSDLDAAAEDSDYSDEKEEEE